MLARIPREGSKTRDITGGLPRVAELFEARKPKDHAIIAEIDGPRRVRQGLQDQAPHLIVPERRGRGAGRVPDPQGQAHRGAGRRLRASAAISLIDGNPVPHDILRVLGVEALADYLVNEIQEVYRLQGVKINDKHIEVIVRQMLQKVEIIEPGDTTFLIGEQIDRRSSSRERQARDREAEACQGRRRCCRASPRPACRPQSFISAASFQETTRVLTEAAVSGKVDTLQGLKENVIVGRLIPAGTGAVMNRLQAIAAGPRPGRDADARRTADPADDAAGRRRAARARRRPSSETASRTPACTQCIAGVPLLA